MFFKIVQVADNVADDFHHHCPFSVTKSLYVYLPTDVGPLRRKKYDSALRRQLYSRRASSERVKKKKKRKEKKGYETR